VTLPRGVDGRGGRSRQSGGFVMSVLISGKFSGDTAKFRQSLVDRASEYAQIGEQARAAGAIHHRFGVGDGFVLLVDEWESVEKFQQFFANPQLQAFIGEVGAAGAPDLTVTEAVSSPDEF
jgi:hypothetical protein